ncbi:MAG: hypothetical protein EKK46_08360 [Rhodocyclaceae bacterium]|nr:MAG: hypothetical protein EKK46_08360 [Rhodocyclaceae bacterium]
MSHLEQMRAALYLKLHSVVAPARQAAPGRGEVQAWPWRRHLPTEWHGAVTEPLGFRRFRDYEASAQRVVGVDENEQPCYCHYEYRLSEARSDDDEDFYEETLYLEIGISWRLRDGRWLTFRRIGGVADSQGFFSFSEEMPR